MLSFNQWENLPQVQSELADINEIQQPLTCAGYDAHVKLLTDLYERLRITLDSVIEQSEIEYHKALDSLKYDPHLTLEKIAAHADFVTRHTPKELVDAKDILMQDAVYFPEMIIGLRTKANTEVIMNICNYAWEMMHCSAISKQELETYNKFAIEYDAIKDYNENEI